VVALKVIIPKMESSSVGAALVKSLVVGLENEKQPPTMALEFCYHT